MSRLLYLPAFPFLCAFFFAVVVVGLLCRFTGTHPDDIPDVPDPIRHAT